MRLKSPVYLHWLLSVVCFSSPLVVAGELTATDAVVVDQKRMERDQSRNLNNKNKSVLPTASPSTPSGDASIPQLPTAGGPCFKIKSTEVDSGNKALPLTPPFIQRLNGRCADVRAISELLNDLNQFYQQQGLITTRAYVPKQNLKLGTLRLEIKPGVVERFEYADEKPLDTRIAAAFPLKGGDLVELRQLEQGLDNFNTPESQSGQFKLQPGSQQGQSVIQIEVKQQKPWRIKASLDNSGYETTGKTKGSVDASYDNLLGLNDTLTLGYNVNTDDHPMRTSQSSSVKISIPYQKGSWTIGHSHQDFARTIQGINQNYNVAGNSRVTSLGVERLLHRDQQARAYVYGKLERKRSRNYIEDYEIETQRRNLTVLSAGVRGDKKYPDKSKWEWQVGGKFGIGAFNAMKDIPGPAVSRFELITLNTTYTKPIQDGRYTYIGTFSAQGSKRELPGSEQFGAGGRYDVRGFHEDSLYGNTGAFLRNTFEAKPLKEDDVELTPYIGWDIGWVDEPATTTWSKPLITGAAIGSRLKWGKNLEAEATYTHALKRPSEFTATRDQIYLNATLKF